MKIKGTKIFIGLIEGVINNENEFKDFIAKLNYGDELIICDGPRDVFNRVIAAL